MSDIDHHIDELLTFLSQTDGPDRALGSKRLVSILHHLDAAFTRGPNTRPHRWQDPLILDIITPGSRVLDLGCGNGELLVQLRKNKKVVGQGVELDTQAVLHCLQHQVPVIQTDIDECLSSFSSSVFDFVVLEETLQTLYFPVDTLEEMLRVGRRCIVSFPNFGYWQVRLNLLLRGRMPVTKCLRHRWFDTPNIHLFSLEDFLSWTRSAGVKVTDAWVLVDGDVRPMQDQDNVHAEEALLVIEHS